MAPLKGKPQLALFVIFSVSLIFWSGITERLDFILYDTALKLTSLPISDKVVVIAIDEKSIHELGQWPWRRNIHAKLLNRLKTLPPKAIGLDIIFSEPSLQYPEDDIALAQAIHQANNVNLPIFFMPLHQGASLTEIHPIPLLAASAKNLAHIHVELDNDGIARGIYEKEGMGDAKWPALFTSLLNRSQNSSTQIHKQVLSFSTLKQNVKENFRLIPFSKNSTKITSYSYVDVYRGRVNAAKFFNKIVLVGATAAGLGDQLPTPVSGKTSPMPGVYIHANAVSAQLGQNMIKPISDLWVWAISLIIALFPLLFFDKFSPSKTLLVSVSIAIIYILLCFSLLNLQQIWLKPAIGVIGILLTYPLWSRQKLMQLNLFLNEELDLLQNEPVLPHASGHLSIKHRQLPRAGEKIADQIKNVRNAISALKQQQKEKDRLISFLSHDVRSPLVSQLATLEGLKSARKPFSEETIDLLASQAERSLGLAEQFLQVARAEQLLEDQFVECEINTIIENSLDEQNAYAQSKNIQLKFDYQDEIWISASAELLERAFNNIINNAIKYSPESSNIKIELNKTERQICISFTDEGVGISPMDIPLLFMPFRRLPGITQKQRGSGLGLHFVKTVIEKHAGTIEVLPNKPDGSQFVIKFPVFT